MCNEIDYHDYCDVNTPKEEREKLYIGDIYSNAIKCKKCGYFIRSKNRHHMITCKCGDVSVDGGSWYHKVNFKDNAEWEDRVIAFNDVKRNDTPNTDLGLKNIMFPEN